MADSDKKVMVSANDIHKEFILPQSKNSSFKQSFVNIVKKNNKVTQKVLDGVSFEVKEGDFFGVVGRNGSGKSTLLKLLAGVYVPTSGEVKMNGKLTPFIELGVGFNPELSGRDNVFLNGALLGFDRKQMSAMYDDIVDFAELGPFMDQKLKNYSSGMQVRLAFSIAIKAKNDILIFDEVLAVGDEAFQRKCLDTFDKYKATGQTVILVTHSMDTVRHYCNKAILVDKGSIIASGDPNKVADIYSKLNQDAIDASKARKNLGTNNSGIKVALNKAGKKSNSFAVNEAMQVDLKWNKEFKPGAIWIDLYKMSGEHVSNFISNRDGLEKISTKTSASVSIDLNLTPGSYYIDVGFWNETLERKLESIYPAAEFIVTSDWSKSDRKFGGLTGLNSSWK